MGNTKKRVIKLLKKYNLYNKTKLLKDNILFFFRDRFYFNKEMTNFYSQFIHKGDLCFDIGSSYGNRVKAFLDVGASKVIAVEPLKYNIKKLKSRYSKNKKVLIEEIGIGDTKKEGKLFISPAAPFMSTFDKGIADNMKNDSQMVNIEYQNVETVKIDTIDSLIKKYGVPNFIKIDIEGLEPSAFRGLSYPIKCLSFEYMTKFKDRAFFCIDRLGKLGKYEFNYSIQETMKLNSKNWLNASEMKSVLMSIPKSTYSGDIYARKIK